MKQGRRRITRKIAMVCGVLLAGLVVSWLVVPGLGISIPLDSFRDPIEIAASRALGREVRINGALALRPTLRPIIVAHDVRIVSPAGQGDLLQAGRVAVWLSPVALLRGELHGLRILIEEASIELDTRLAVAPGAANAEVYPRLTNAALLAAQPELQELLLRQVALHYRGDSTRQAYPVKLDEVSIHARAGQPLELMLRGRFQQQPYSMELTGGRLADLLTPTGPWSWRAGVSFADKRLLFNGNLETSRQGLEVTLELREDWPVEYARLVESFGLASLAGRLSLRIEHGRPVVDGELQLPALAAVLRFGDGSGPAMDRVDLPARGAEVLAEQPVNVPLTLMIADVPFYGQLTMAGDGTEPVVELVLSATDANADRLLTTLTGTTAVSGRFRHVGLQASVRASGEEGILNRVALAVQLDGAKLSYGNAVGERSVAVTLDKLALTLPAGQAMRMRARGALLDEAFSVNFMASGLEALLLESSWPIRLSATGSGAVLDMSGPVARGAAATRLHVGLYGKRIGELSAWLGVSPCAAAPYTLRGELVLASDIGRLQFLQLQTSGTRLNGELDWSGDDQIALTHAVLHFDELDPADVVVLSPLVNQGSADSVAGGFAIDIPLLPRRVEIINADVDLAIAHILFKPMDISDVSLAARIREGKLRPSTFHAHVGAASFEGYLDPTVAETAVVFENEDYGGADGGRMGQLFSSAVRWVGSFAIVPLRWIFMKNVSVGDTADCQAQGVKAGN
jgi:hypothetical protein